jgi:hypothetical protein
MVVVIVVEVFMMMNKHNLYSCKNDTSKYYNYLKPGDVTEINQFII